MFPAGTQIDYLYQESYAIGSVCYQDYTKSSKTNLHENFTSGVA